MGSSESAAEAAVAAAFLNQWLADAEAGRERTAAEYRAMWPRHGRVVERELERLAATPPAGGEPLRCGPYVVERELGRGGQAVVHLARDERLGRRVALKVLAGAGTRELAARFRREALVASRLDHPGICAVYDSGVEGGAAYIAMQYVEGATLASLVASARLAREAGDGAARIELPAGRSGAPREPWEPAARLFAEAARALHAAHEAGVVHRDVKPGNVMVTPDGRPVLLDFGLARDERSDASGLTLTGDVFGTPAYMSPEQVSGARTDRRTDVWSLAASLYECLALERPFREPTREALYRAILESAPPDPRASAPDVPEDLAVIVATGLERDLDRRYQTAEDLALDLERALAREPIRARPAGPWLRLRRACQRNPALAGTAAIAFGLLVLALGVTLLWLRTSEESRLSLIAKSDALDEANRDLDRANRDLTAALVDARAGRLTKLEQRVQELVDAGFQTLFGGSWKGAGERFREALDLDPKNLAALAGLFWFELEARGDALAALERAPADAPVVHWMRALALDRAGDEEGAERERELADAPSDAGGADLRAYLEGLRAVRTFAYDAGPEPARAALPHFERAVALARRPQFSYWHSLMMAADRAGDRATVDRAAEALEHHWPESQATWEAVAQFYFGADPERSLAAMRRILDLGPSGMAHVGIAQHLLTRGDRDGARAELDLAVATEPDLPAAHFMRGSFLLESGELAAAVDDLEEALRLEPANPYPFALLRSALEASGDERAALDDASLRAVLGVGDAR